MSNKILIPEIKDGQNIFNIKTLLHHRRVLLIAITVGVILCAVILSIGGDRETEMIIVDGTLMRIEEGGTAKQIYRWDSDIVVDEKLIHVEMDFYTSFAHNKTKKTVEMVEDSYHKYSSSGGKADNYFSDIEIADNYIEASFFKPAEYTSILTFKCNGESVRIEVYEKSNGKGGTNLYE